jgi:hypothetical protein
MSVMSRVTPAIVVLSAVIHVWRKGFAVTYVLVGALLIFFAEEISRYMFNRSRNKEASFGAVRVRPSEWGFEEAQADIASILGAILFCLMAVFMPIFERLALAR